MQFENIINESKQIKLKDQEIGKRFSINLILKTKSKYGDNFLLYNKKYNVVMYANAQIKGYVSKMSTNLKSKGDYFYVDEKLSDIIQFKIKNIDVGDDQKVKVDIEIIKNNKNTYTSEKIPLSDDEKVETNIYCKTSKKEQKKTKNEKYVLETSSDESEN